MAWGLPTPRARLRMKAKSASHHTMRATSPKSSRGADPSSGQARSRGHWARDSTLSVQSRAERLWLKRACRPRKARTNHKPEASTAVATTAPLSAVTRPRSPKLMPISVDKNRFRPRTRAVKPGALGSASGPR